MSINQRQHIRFSLDIPAIIHTKFGEMQETTLQQISIGGCFTGWEENVYINDEFRMELELPNKNYLPLYCKALYRFEHTGIGVQFVDICEFEQELISRIIAHKLDTEGVPLQVNPFVPPPTFFNEGSNARLKDIRAKSDPVLEAIMAGDNEL